jgi:molybdopterin synthase sulfur carrier subunit
VAILYNAPMQISFYATLRKIVGRKTIDLPLPAEATLRDLLHAVLEAHPALRDDLLDESDQLSRHVHLFVDGRSTKHLAAGLSMRVDSRQKIEFFPAVAGG